MALMYLPTSGYAQADSLTIFSCGMQDSLIPGGTAPAAGTQDCDQQDILEFLSDHPDDFLPQGVSRLIRIRTNVILLQNAQGEGNWSPSTDTQDREFLDDLYAEINSRLANLTASCGSTPSQFSEVGFEFVPTYIEVQDEFTWDHRSDLDNGFGGLRTSDPRKQYLQSVMNVAQAHPNYAPGFDVISSVDGSWFYGWDPQVEPLWSYDPFETDGFHYQLGGAGVWYSGWPSDESDLFPLWHLPDAYLIYLQKLNNWEGTWFNYERDRTIQEWAAGFIHEYGHYFGLSHSSAGGCQRNFMVVGGGDANRAKDNFNDMQMRSIYRALMAQNTGLAVICENRADHDLIVTQDETWSGNFRMFGDIVVKDGATLTVTCEIEMSPQARIYVERGGKLELDGGTLTGCGDYWQGIKVEGYADYSSPQTAAGWVDLKNGAVIENARDAISMDNEHLGWPTLRNYYGGLVTAENSTFRDCHRAVEFMPYALADRDDLSSFVNCSFENMNTAITSWGSDGVEFRNCTFDGMDVSAFYTINGNPIVREGCVVQNTPIGVDLTYSTPVLGLAARIGGENPTDGNDIQAEARGIRVTAAANASARALTISNNTVSSTANGSTGITVSGYGTPALIENAVDGDYAGLVLSDLGEKEDSPITVAENVMNNSRVGVQVSRENPELLFVDNCLLLNPAIGIRVLSNSSIRLEQKNIKEDRAADNRFTHTSPAYRAIRNESSATINYHCRTADMTSEYYPVNSLNVNIIEGTASGQTDGPCGPDNLTGGQLPPDVMFSQCLDTTVAFADALAAITTLQSSVVGGDSLLVDGCLHELRLHHALYLLKQDSFDRSVDYLLEQKALKTQMFGYGLLTMTGEYVRARSSLSKLDAVTGEELNFVWSQHLYLDYLEDRLGYKLSAGDSLTLRSIGLTDGPLNGYARSIFQELTGSALDLPIDIFVPIAPLNEGQEAISTAVDERETTILAYPNPSPSGRVTLRCTNASVRGATLRVYSDRGRLLRTLPVSGHTTRFNLRNYHGLAYLRLTAADGSEVATTKIVVQ